MIIVGDEALGEVESNIENWECYIITDNLKNNHRQLMRTENW